MEATRLKHQICDPATPALDDKQLSALHRKQHSVETLRKRFRPTGGSWHPNTRLVGDVAGKRSERGSICFGETRSACPFSPGAKGRVDHPRSACTAQAGDARQEK